METNSEPQQERSTVTRRLPQVEQQTERWPEWVFPGWHVAFVGSDLKRGAVRPLEIAGKELAIFRTEDGRPVVLDRYCVHQGASLAMGKVIGATLRCPFHHWTFGTDGACTSVPFCNKIPARAQVKTYPVIERFGLIWLYTGDNPDPSRLPREDQLFTDGRYHLDRALHRGTVQTNSRDVFENGLDFAHIRAVHYSDPKTEMEFEIEPNGFGTTSFRSRVRRVHFFGVPFEAFGEILPPSLWCLGLNLSFPWQTYRSRYIFASQPVSPNETRCFSAHFMQGKRYSPLDRMVSEVVHLFWHYGLRDDMRIWQDKRILERPLLTAADGPIMKYRRGWAEQEALARQLDTKGGPLLGT